MERRKETQGQRGGRGGEAIMRRKRKTKEGEELGKEMEGWSEDIFLHNHEAETETSRMMSNL